jgi:hypothetical protein
MNRQTIWNGRIETWAYFNISKKMYAELKRGKAPDTLWLASVGGRAAACRYSKGCDGGDVIDVIRYMKHFGVPDESCMPYSATDHTKYGKKAKKCPAEGYCMNCMPLKVRRWLLLLPE